MSNPIFIKYFWFEVENIWIERVDRRSGDAPVDYRLKVGEFEPPTTRCIGFESAEERDKEYERVDKIISEK